MPIPSGTPIEWRGTTKTLEASGGSITNNSVVQADDASYNISTDGEGVVDAEFALSFTYATAPTEGTPLALYARPLNVDSTGDTEVPELARPTMYIGSFIVNNVTTLQYAICRGTDLPLEADYYIANVATGQTVSSGWTLKVTPIGVTPKV